MNAAHKSHTSTLAICGICVSHVTAHGGEPAPQLHLRSASPQTAAGGLDCELVSTHCFHWVPLPANFNNMLCSGSGAALGRLMPAAHHAVVSLQRTAAQGLRCSDSTILQRMLSSVGPASVAHSCLGAAIEPQPQRQQYHLQHHTAALLRLPQAPHPWGQSALRYQQQQQHNRSYRTCTAAAASHSSMSYSLGRFGVPCPSMDDLSTSYTRSQNPATAPRGTSQRSSSPQQRRHKLTGELVTTEAAPAAAAGRDAGYDDETDTLDVALTLRQHMEEAPLPPEIKRAVFTDLWEEYVIKVKRTAKVTKSGRLLTSHVLLAVGNLNGLVGIGSASGSNVQQVMMSALAAAYRNVVPVARYRAHTLYHPVDLSRRKLRVQMWPRPAGWGVVASPLVRALCRVAGIQDVTIKVTGRRKSRWNLVKLWMEALQQQVPPHEGVEGTGVYVREVWAGKKLPHGLRR